MDAYSMLTEVVCKGIELFWTGVVGAVKVSVQAFSIRCRDSLGAGGSLILGEGARSAAQCSGARRKNGCSRLRMVSRHGSFPGASHP